MRLQDKVAVVTGAARGIGKEIALALAQEGADVAVTDIDEELATATAAEIGALGVRSLAVRADASKREDARAVAEKVVAELGRIDILVNNAGITRDSIFIRMKESDWDLVLSINLNGVLNGLREITPLMAEQGWGRVVNIASVVGQIGNAGQANYSTSKGAVIGLTQDFARELGRTGVTVNAVAPGFIDTDMTKSLPDKVKDELLRTIPVGRLGRPEEVAEAVVFFCAAAEYVTGQVINVDGGMVMR